MVSIIIKDWNTGELYGHLKAKELKGILDSEFLDVLNRSKDLFRLWGARSIADTGIRKSQTSKNVIRNKPRDCRGEDFEPDFMGVVMDDGSFEKTNIKLDITVYPRGYVLNVGMPIVNIFGTSNPAYLKCIGKRKAYRTTIDKCHVFPTTKSLLSYVTKHESVLQYLHDEAGWVYSMEYACANFQDEIEMSGCPKSEGAAEQKVNDLLEKINSVEKQKQIKQTPADPTMDDIAEEIQYRMASIGIMEQVQKKYRDSGEIYMSKFGGILYNLDEDAKKAIAIVQKDGNFPYHVVVSHTMIGDMYAVLYSSQDSTEWDSERFTDGSCLAYVYNATYPECSEYGPIGIQSANGGIIRTY